jgi:predicted lipid-binding transport protein (Tim44 family)
MRRTFFVAATLLALTVFCAQTASPTTADSQATARQVQSPRAVLQALMSAFNRHDFAALDTLFAPEGVYEDFAARFRGVGPGQVKNFLRASFKRNLTSTGS